MDAATAASSSSSGVGREASSHLHQRRGGSTGSNSGLGGAAASAPGGAAGAAAGEDSRFECNVCLDSPDEPVVTLCGHLFCWPCLYRWLSSQNQNTCPVCKAGVTKENVIPLYGRGTEPVDPRTKPRRREQGGESVPGRPQAQRPEARPQQGGGPGGGTYGAMPGFGMGGFPFGMSQPARAGVSFSAGFGFFPSLFGLQFQTFTPPMPAGSGAGNQNMSADEAQQAFLSKLLLMLGIFTLGVLVFC